MTIDLKGITLGHSRGFLPMVATTQRFHETHPEVRIDWEIRSLQKFADASLASLAPRYDLLIIDHPSSGHAAEGGMLAPLEDWVSPDFLADQAANSVGPSYESYTYAGHQWGLAIDAATPISGWRADLLKQENISPPATWDSLLELAKHGLVAIPAIPIDSLMHFYMLCNGLGEAAFSRPDAVVEESVGVRALEMQRQLMQLCDPGCFSMNPIAVWERLAASTRVAYCPFAYGYSNYSRAGYAAHVLSTGGLIALENGRVCRSTLGGAGLAISSACKHKEVAAEYACYVASRDCQTTLYFDSGGQPGYRAAWTNDEVNRRSNRFFANTLSTLCDAYLRPRFSGYLDFQQRAGLIVHRYLTRGESAKLAMAALNQLLLACPRRGQENRA
jgi:multiple sugar transport system substrate-binding protein